VQIPLVALVSGKPLNINGGRVKIGRPIGDPAGCGSSHAWPVNNSLGIHPCRDKQAPYFCGFTEEKIIVRGEALRGINEPFVAGGD
jgi:hypothetical protein